MKSQHQTPQQQKQPTIFKSYLIFFNIQKKKNLGTLIRTAAAFNVQQIFYIDSSKNPKKFNTFGSQGTSTQMLYRMFPNIKAIRQYCNQNNIKICGIQIMEQTQLCKPINLTTFTCSTAFMLGNEQSGLNSNQKQICDFFTYIPQYSNKTACLNVAVAGSIILYHFAINSGLKQQQIKGEKFDEQGEEKKSQQVFKKKKLDIVKMIQQDGQVIEEVLGVKNKQIAQVVDFSSVEWIDDVQSHDDD